VPGSVLGVDVGEDLTVDEVVVSDSWLHPFTTSARMLAILDEAEFFH
jgi:hypothetical protein